MTSAFTYVVFGIGGLMIVLSLLQRLQWMRRGLGDSALATFLYGIAFTLLGFESLYHSFAFYMLFLGVLLTGARVRRRARLARERDAGKPA